MEYKTVLQLDPKFPEAHYNIGVILYYQGKMDDAIGEFLEEIEVNHFSATPTTTSPLPITAREIWMML